MSGGHTEHAPPRRITVLGATGSIGQATLEIVACRHERFRVEALTAAREVERLAQLARRFRPRFVAIAEPSRYAPLRDALAGTGIEIGAGAQAIRDAAARPSDWVMAAIVGAAGLLPTLEAVRRGAIVALANKECLVCAGELFMREVRQHRAVLLPVDSEHNAIFQALLGSRPEQVERIVLTASGGPFRGWSLERMARATPEEALAHPNWQMGPKITVDSATMMNKGLEIVEARHLFDLPEERIEIVVHPQSAVHGIVQFVDGAMIAQMAPPDMRIPISYTLAWPERLELEVPRLDLRAMARLEFEDPDETRFPAPALARAALRRGGAAPTVLNAANEVAVRAFLERRIGFLDIVRVVEEALALPLAQQPLASIEDALAIDARVRELVGRRLGVIPAT